MNKNETADKLAPELYIFIGLTILIAAIIIGVFIGNKTGSFSVGASTAILISIAETGIWIIASFLQNMYDALIEINKKLPATATKEEQ